MLLLEMIFLFPFGEVHFTSFYEAFRRALGYASIRHSSPEQEEHGHFFTDE